MLTEDIVRIQIESANDSRAETGDAALDERVSTATTAWCKAQTTEPLNSHPKCNSRNSAIFS